MAVNTQIRQISSTKVAVTSTFMPYMLMVGDLVKVTYGSRIVIGKVLTVRQHTMDDKMEIVSVEGIQSALYVEHATYESRWYNMYPCKIEGIVTTVKDLDTILTCAEMLADANDAYEEKVGQ